MKNFLMVLFLFTMAAIANGDVPISSLPLNSSPASVNTNDSFPYVDTSGTPTTKRLRISGLPTTPAFTSKFSLYAPLDNPTFTGTATGTFAGSLSGSATNVTGIVAGANGGTGMTVPTAGSMIYSNGTSWSTAGSGCTNGQVLVSDGSGVWTCGNASSGSVTSVGLSAPSIFTVTNSPVTSSGTLTLSYSGTALPIANGGTGGTTANGALNNLLPSQATANGKVLQSDGTNTSWVTPAATGVTSVAATVPSFLSISGSPITTSGTLAISLSGTALPLANGGTGQTSFSSGVLKSNGTVLSSGTVDLTSNVNGTLPIGNGGTGQTSFSTGLLHSNGTVLSSSAVALGSDVSGQLPIANGGTGAATKAAGFDALSPMTTVGDIIYGGTSGTGTRLAAGSANTVLQANGAAAPTWVTPFLSMQSLKAVSATLTTKLRAYYNQFTTLASGILLLETRNSDLLLNSNFEGTNATDSWTMVSGSVGADETGSGNVYMGEKSLKVTMTSVNGDSMYQDVTPTINTFGRNMQYGVCVKTGTATNLQVCARQNGAFIAATCVNVTADGNYGCYYPNLTGPATGTSVGVGIKTTQSTSGTYYADYAGVIDAGNITQGFPTQTTYTTLTSGTSQTYTPPVGVTRIFVRMVGGGAGGSGSGTSQNAGTAGNATSFSTCTAPGGGAGGSGGGAGGSAGVTSCGVNGRTIPGGGGGGTGLTLTTGVTCMPGGMGGSSAFGGAGSSGTQGSTGGTAAANSGGGGGGGGTACDVANNLRGGGGGGSGAYTEFQINNPSSAGYTYTVGGTAAGGTTSTSGAAGGPGAAGLIIIEEIYGGQTTVTPNQVADMLGTTFYTGASTCPTNSLAADGTAVSRTTYSNLFARISTTFGTGDGSTTFNVPDLRGIFVRGAGSQTISAISYSGTLGTKQGDQMQGHSHGYNGGSTVPNAATTYLVTTNASNAGGTAAITGPITDGTNGTPRTGSETRPANIGMTPCIWTVSTPMPLITMSVAAYDNPTGVTAINTVKSTAVDYTATALEETILVDTSSAARTISLPPAASVKGKKYIIQITSSSNNATIDPNASETICGQTTVKLIGADDAMEIYSDGTNWRSKADCYKTVSNRMSATTSSTCSVNASDNGTWVTGCSSSASIMTLTLTGFSSFPRCQAICDPATNGKCVMRMNGVGSSTSLSLYPMDATTGSAINGEFFNLTCKGPRG